MKKIVRLTESELKNIVEKSVRRAIKEGAVDEYGLKDFGKDALMAGGLGAAGAAGLAGNALYNSDEPEINPEQQEINMQTKQGLGQNVLEPGGMPDNDTISWEDAINNPMHENRIRRAVRESIMNLMKG
jgi:hypothetical protein